MMLTMDSNSCDAFGFWTIDSRPSQRFGLSKSYPLY
jgi:hypothetical protein